MHLACGRRQQTKTLKQTQGVRRGDLTCRPKGCCRSETEGLVLELEGDHPFWVVMVIGGWGVP